MAYRYQKITDLAQARYNEQICAVYDNPLLNTEGTKKDKNIIKALADAKEDRCKLVVWRSDEDKDYYQYIDKKGRLREWHGSGAKIVDYSDYKKEKAEEDEGYKYFAMGLLISLTEGSEDPRGTLIQVEDRAGHLHNVASAHMDPDNNILTLRI